MLGCRELLEFCAHSPKPHLISSLNFPLGICWSVPPPPVNIKSLVLVLLGRWHHCAQSHKCPLPKDACPLGPGTGFPLAFRGLLTRCWLCLKPLARLVTGIFRLQVKPIVSRVLSERKRKPRGFMEAPLIMMTFVAIEYRKEDFTMDKRLSSRKGQPSSQ